MGYCFAHEHNSYAEYAEKSGCRVQIFHTCKMCAAYIRRCQRSTASPILFGVLEEMWLMWAVLFILYVFVK